jgi:DNA polymerase
VWTGKPHEAYGIRYAMNDVWLTARLPSGRLLWYPFPEKVRKAMPWDPDDIRPGFTFQAMKMGQWKFINAFGGQLTENVVMGIERDIMTGGMLRLEANGYRIVLQVHDDAIAEVPVKRANLEEYTQIMCDVEPWVHELKIPIAVEGWCGGRYRK